MWAIESFTGSRWHAASRLLVRQEPGGCATAGDGIVGEVDPLLFGYREVRQGIEDDVPRGLDGRSGANPPYGTSSGWWVFLPGRLGAVHESAVPEAARRNSGGRCRPASLALVIGELPVVHTRWVAISVVSSVDPALLKQRTKMLQGRCRRHRVTQALRMRRVQGGIEDNVRTLRAY